MSGTHWIVEGRIDPRWPINTRGNIGEVFPEVLTPLTYELGVKPAEAGWREAYSMMGIADRRDFDSTELPVIIGLYGGYGYLNLSYLRMLGVRAPGSSPEAIDVAFFGEGNPPPYDPKPGDKRRVATVRILRIVLKALSQKSMPEPVADSERVVAEWEARQPDLATASDDVLLRYLHDYPPVFKQVFRNHMITTGTAAIVSGVLSDGATSCGRPGLVTELLGAADGVVSAQYSQDLWKVAQIVQRTPAVAAAFDAGVEGVGERVADDPRRRRVPRRVRARSSAGTVTAARTTGSCRHGPGRTRPSSPTRRSSACATAPTTCRPRRGSPATTPGGPRPRRR